MTDASSLAKPRRDRVFLLDPIDAAGLQLLEGSVDVTHCTDRSAGAVIAQARESDGIIVRSRLPAEVFDEAPRVRAVAIHGSGTDWVPLESAAIHGVLVSNLPAGNAQSVAEYCAMAMLMLARRQPQISNATRQGAWDGARALAQEASELRDATVGIIGVGAIGTGVARIARHGLGMRVLGCRASSSPVPAEFEPATLDNLLARSDYIVIACPLTPATRHLIDRPRLARIRPQSWLINVGRGAVVDQLALVSALKDRSIAGAMLDVYENDKLAQGDPLLELDNVVLTPHLAGSTIQSRRRMGKAVATDMLAMLAGASPGNPLTPLRGPNSEKR